MSRHFRISALLLSSVLALTAAFVAPAPLSAHTAPEQAVQAHQMLGPGIWSRAVKLENRNGNSRYPSTLYATVFEFDNSLWFYTSTGTQPIVRSRNRVGQYRENLLPLLQTIERGFASVTLLPATGPALSDFPKLENGCVIESIFTLEQLRRKGEAVEKAKLLLYSTTRNSRRGVGGNARGHAVLVFETPAGRFFVDPPEIHVVKPLPGAATWDPVQFATTIEAPYGKMEIREAFFVPVDGSGEGTTGSALYSGEG
jgi:hypothetical protein